MPKQLHELKKFMSGTMTTPSERDIPEDAAVYSKNLDSVTEDGKLKSIPDDLEILEEVKASGWIQIKENPVNGESIILNGVTINFTSS
jgi:hypothetical protein